MVGSLFCLIVQWSCEAMGLVGAVNILGFALSKSFLAGNATLVPLFLVFLACHNLHKTIIWGAHGVFKDVKSGYVVYYFVKVS